MRIIDITEVSPNAKILSFDDVAMSIRLWYRPLVDELLEAFTDFTDYDIIEEVVNTLHLPLACVIEPITNNQFLVHGYIGKVIS
ncbi:hypothetical protein [Methanobrevibacter sp.]